MKSFVTTWLEKISASLGITPDELKKAAFVPVLLLVMVIIGDIIWRAVGLPDVEGTIALIKDLFTTHGYWLVFVAAFIEAFLLIGLYVPGSVALILAATLAGQGVLNIWWVILLVIAGCFAAVICNYILGRYGWYHLLVRFGLKDAIEKMKARAETRGIKLIHFTYFNPNVASLSATSFGILRVNFFKFLFHSIIALIYWNTLWGLSFYFLGDWIEGYINYRSLIGLIVVIIICRIVYVVVKNSLQRKRMSAE